MSTHSTIATVLNLSGYSLRVMKLLRHMGSSKILECSRQASSKLGKWDSSSGSLNVQKLKAIGLFCADLLKDISEEECRELGFDSVESARIAFTNDSVRTAEIVTSSENNLNNNYFNVSQNRNTQVLSRKIINKSFSSLPHFELGFTTPLKENNAGKSINLDCSAVAASPEPKNHQPSVVEIKARLAARKFRNKTNFQEISEDSLPCVKNDFTSADSGFSKNSTTIPNNKILSCQKIELGIRHVRSKNNGNLEVKDKQYCSTYNHKDMQNLSLFELETRQPSGILALNKQTQQFIPLDMNERSWQFQDYESKVFQRFGICKMMWEREDIKLTPSRVKNSYFGPLQNATYKTSVANNDKTLIKQEWHDFLVTELSSKGNPVLGRRVEDRDFSTELSLPDFFLKSMGMRTTEDNIFDSVDVASQRVAAASLEELKSADHVLADARTVLQDSTLKTKLEHLGNKGLKRKKSQYHSTYPRERRTDLKEIHLEFVLRKRNVAHQTAVRLIAAALRTSPQNISFAGIKDAMGETLQRVRIKGGSPEAVQHMNKVMLRRGIELEGFNFRYKSEPLRYGELYGNRFIVILRDIKIDEAQLRNSLDTICRKGFANYFGPQRFSWFSGRCDPTLAALNNNWLLFAFRFLDFVRGGYSLRQLLQRERLYPQEFQNFYRHRVIRYLRSAGVEPTMLARFPEIFGESPHSVEHRPDKEFVSHNLGSQMGTGASFRPDFTSRVITCISNALRKAFEDAHLQQKRIGFQAFTSYLWNQLLVLRLHHLGARVLPGDMIAFPKHSRENNTSEMRSWEKSDDLFVLYTRVDAEKAQQACVADVVLPAFQFNGSLMLPEEGTATYEMVHALCNKYGLSWDLRRHEELLCAPPRHMLAFPENVRLKYFEQGLNMEETIRLTKCGSIDEWVKTDPKRNKQNEIKLSGESIQAVDKKYKTKLRDGSKPTFSQALSLQSNTESEVGAKMEEKETKLLPCAVLEFDLPKSAYATVFLTELLHYKEPLGVNDVNTCPAPPEKWDTGKRDPRYIITIEEMLSRPDAAVTTTEFLDASSGNLYRELSHSRMLIDDNQALFLDENLSKVKSEIVGTENVEVGERGEEPEQELSAFDFSGKFVAPDPKIVLKRWGKNVLIKNGKRRLMRIERRAKDLFEEPLAKQMNAEEVQRYLFGHGIPLKPNQNMSVVGRRVNRKKKTHDLKLKRVEPEVKMGAQLKNRDPPAANQLTIHSWNFI